MEFMVTLIQKLMEEKNFKCFAAGFASKKDVYSDKEFVCNHSFIRDKEGKIPTLRLDRSAYRCSKDPFGYVVSISIFSRPNKRKYNFKTNGEVNERDAIVHLKKYFKKIGIKNQK